MGGGGEHIHHCILLPGGDALFAHTALALGGIFADGSALDVPVGGEGKDAFLLLDQVLDVDLVLHILNLRLAVVAVLVGDGLQLLLQDGLYQILIPQHPQIIGDFLLQLLILVLELFPVQPLQSLQAHIQNGLSLDVVQAKALHQVFLGIVIAGADDMDDLVNVVLGNQQTLQQMGPLLSLLQVVSGAPDDDLLLEGQILVDDVPQGQDLRLGLILDQGQHIDGKGALQLRLGKQAVEHHLGVGVPLQLDDDAHTVAVRLILNVADALQTLILHLVGHVLDKHPLVHLIRQLRDDDAGAVVAEFLEFVAGPNHYPAPAGSIGGPDPGPAHDDALCGEVGTLNMLHQIAQGGVRIIQHTDARTDDLPQVMGRDIGGHTYGNAGGTVDQQIGEHFDENAGFFPALIEVGIPVHGVLFDIPEHLVGNPAQTRLRITVGCRGIAIHAAEVAVAVHQHIAHGEILGQAHQGVIHGRVAVGVIPAQHVAHAGGGLLEGAVRGQIVLVHGVENAPVHGLQSVPHVGQGPAHDHGHGVFDIGFFHLRHQGPLHNVLVRVPQLLRVVLWFFAHILFSLWGW